VRPYDRDANEPSGSSARGGRTTRRSGPHRTGHGRWQDATEPFQVPPDG
jgi:hypothetical protein